MPNRLSAQRIEAISRLSAGIAHELNTPMQYVQDNVRFLERAFNDMSALVRAYEALLAAATARDVLGDVTKPVVDAAERADLAYLDVEVPAAFRQSLEGLERIANIVRGLKSLAGPDVDERVAIDLNAEIESTVAVSRNEWKYVAELVLELDRDLPSIPCVAGEIGPVLLHLIINAAHAIADAPATRDGGKGRITIATRRVDGWVELRVSDTGTGIPAAARDHVFEPFFTTKPVGTGAGQGLAVARSVVVEHHGGTITFDTREGQGTTFLVRLPLAA